MSMIRDCFGRLTLGQKLILAVAYGDAFGLPFETAKFSASRKMTGLMPVKNGFLGELPRGTWSDDTHLTIVTAVALAEANGFDIEDIASCHVGALKLTRGTENTHELLSPAFVSETGENAWGVGTMTAVKKIMQGVSPAISGSETRLGNGVLMKVAPLIYWHLARDIGENTRSLQLEIFTRMTHDNNQSVAQTKRYADILSHLNTFGELNGAGYGGDYRDETELRAATPNRGFTSWETLEVALYYFQQEPRFPENIQLAVRYGGDSDSICSILGVMSVFAESYREPEDATELYDYERLKQVGQTLDTALENSILRSK